MTETTPGWSAAIAGAMIALDESARAGTNLDEQVFALFTAVVGAILEADEHALLLAVAGCSTLLEDGHPRPSVDPVESARQFAFAARCLIRRARCG
jgi:hypothetical protein